MSGSKHLASPHRPIPSRHPQANKTPPLRSRVDKVNTEVVTLTYGTLVASLCRDLTLPSSSTKTDYGAVNAELDRMGYAIGQRLIEDFLAKSNTGHCANFRETAEVISKVGFKVFMNVTPTVTGWSQDGKSFGLVFEENPLADFVELPDDGRAQEELWFSNLLCGVVRGALEMVCVVLLWVLGKLGACVLTVMTGANAGRGAVCERCVARE